MLLTKERLQKKLVKGGCNEKDAKRYIKDNFDYLKRCYWLETSLKEAAKIIQIYSNFEY